MKYIYNLAKLNPGDIILVRYPNDELSQKIMETTQSEYSHAMLYVGGSSYIEADDRVQARNLARVLFDDKADTCILRIKERLLEPFTVGAAIHYSRFVVGNPYSLLDALRLGKGLVDNPTADTQICTRLVAKAYAFAGLKIADNIEMCTPQELLESNCVNVYRDFLRVATDFDIRFAESYNVIDDMVKSTELLFDSVKQYDNGKIRSMNALTEYVIKHPADYKPISELLIQSGYLNVLQLDEIKNPYNYDPYVFLEYYGKNAYKSATAALEENSVGLQRYWQEYWNLKAVYFSYGSKSKYLKLLVDLYEQIVAQHERRIAVCYAVMNSPES